MVIEVLSINLVIQQMLCGREPSVTGPEPALVSQSLPEVLRGCQIKVDSGSSGGRMRGWEIPSEADVRKEEIEEGMLELRC